MNEEPKDLQIESLTADAEMQQRLPVAGMYANWFLDYASYVILDRAVPYMEDGMKPVQRRILHVMKEMDDGRFNKVANIIGSAMQYHPHGDTSIGDALVSLGQKDLLIETQGNWGNIETGDSAAAPRYIEARLSKFALEVAFNPKTTRWQLSYDGRKQEPVTLPMKFPMLLAQGVEGIAVGLSTKILPHNFVELIEASIAYLNGQTFTLYPDFPTGGLLDASGYNAGERGGKVRVRARIRELDKKTLVITEVPFGVTTSTLIDSILKANDKGKIKIRHIDDNTARNVEIVVHLAPGTSPDVTIDALFAFTDCEVSISPNCCIIDNERPLFTNVNEVLRRCTNQTVALLKLELEIRQSELGEAWHFASLEKIFIENRIYRDIEEAETFEAVLGNIRLGLQPFLGIFRREITEDDILRLTEIRIKRISKYDSFQADEAIKGIEAEQAEVANHLANLTAYAIRYYEQLGRKYGKGRERKAELRTFDIIQATSVAAATQKLYVNRAEGFVGTSLKKDEFVSDCSDLDDAIVFLKDGSMKVIRVADKIFVGTNIIHVEVFRKQDDRTVYHLVYQNGKEGLGGPVMAKRFQVQGITRDKSYDLTRGTAGSQVLYFSANPNGEAEMLRVELKALPRLKVLTLDFDFGQQLIKGRTAAGNILSRTPVRKITRKSRGASTLGGRAIYYDSVLARLNAEGHGEYLGSFEGADRILVLYADGSYELTGYELTNRYDAAGAPVLELSKYMTEGPMQSHISALYYHGGQKQNFVKRFVVEVTASGKRTLFISEEPGTKLLLATARAEPVFLVNYAKVKGITNAAETLEIATLTEPKGVKALGRKLNANKIASVVLESYRSKPTEAEITPEIEVPIMEIAGEEVNTEAIDSSPHDTLF